MKRETNEKILSDIFPQLTDSLRINTMNLFPPPPPPLYDRDSNFIGIDTVIAELILKKYEQRLRTIDSVDSRLLIGLVDSCLTFSPDELKNRTYSHDELIGRIVDNNKGPFYNNDTLKVRLIRVPSDCELLLLSDLKNEYGNFWSMDNRRFGGLIAMSTVLFDNEYSYGLLKIETYSDYLEGAGYFVLIEKRSGRWVVKKIYNDWVS